jgi:hypothetical protein
MTGRVLPWTGDRGLGERRKGTTKTEKGREKREEGGRKRDGDSSVLRLELVSTVPVGM